MTDLPAVPDGRYIIGHTHPDWDCLTAAWLLWRVHFNRGVGLLFLPIDAPQPLLLMGAAAVVDIGGEYDPARLRFDHHQIAEGITSATQLVYDWLMARPDAVQYRFLAPLIDLVTGADNGLQEHNGMSINTSALVGIHAELAAHKRRQEVTDQLLWDWARGKLEVIADELRARWLAYNNAQTYVTWASRDGAIVVTRNGGKSVTDALLMRGAHYVLFADTVSGRHQRGMMRSSIAGLPPVGALLQAAQESPDEALRNEIAQWFVHPRGFYAGLGSSKASPAEPMTVTIEEVGEALWQAVYAE